MRTQSTKLFSIRKSEQCSPFDAWAENFEIFDLSHLHKTMPLNDFHDFPRDMYLFVLSEMWFCLQRDHRTRHRAIIMNRSSSQRELTRLH